MIAALFVHTNGAYFGLPDVEPWDEKRDARKYAGPYPIWARREKSDVALRRSPHVRRFAGVEMGVDR